MLLLLHTSLIELLELSFLCVAKFILLTINGYAFKLRSQPKWNISLLLTQLIKIVFLWFPNFSPLSIAWNIVLVIGLLCHFRTVIWSSCLNIICLLQWKATQTKMHTTQHRAKLLKGWKKIRTIPKHPRANQNRTLFL